jgi:hypothetical protein
VITVVRGGGGGVATGITTVAEVAGFAAVAPSSLTTRLSRVVVVSHQRRWRSIPGGGATHQGGSAVEGGWGGRPLWFESSGSKKKRT